MNRPLAAALLVVSTGCTFPLRATTRDKLSASESEMVVHLGLDEATARVVAAFAPRGIHVVDRRDARGGGVVLKLRRTGPVVSMVGGSKGSTSTSLAEVGSVYYAALAPAGAGTRVTLYGKPTFQGAESCLPEDPAPFRCDTGVVEVPGGASDEALGHLVDGRDESETVRGIFLELAIARLGTAPERAAAVAPSSAPAQPTWTAWEARIDAPLRAGPDAATREVAHVRAGDRMEATEVLHGFRRVRTADGRTGWIDASALAGAW